MATRANNNDDDDAKAMPEAMARGYISGGGLVPVPDPTKLTTMQLRREIDGVREIVETQMKGMVEVRDAMFANVGTRLSEMDKAIILLQTITNKTPDFVRDQVGQLKDVHNEKISGMISTINEKIGSLSDVTTQMFKSIDDRFAEKDKAVSVGLQAQKESAAAQQASNTEATMKMESNFTKLLDQGRELFNEGRRNTELQISDIKSRLDKGEGRGSISDPAVNNAIAQLATEVRALRDQDKANQGHKEGLSSVGAMVLGVFVAISSLLGLASLIVTLVQHR